MYNALLYSNTCNKQLQTLTNGDSVMISITKKTDSFGDNWTFVTFKYIENSLDHDAITHLELIKETLGIEGGSSETITGGGKDVYTENFLNPPADFDQTLMMWRMKYS